MRCHREARQELKTRTLVCVCVNPCFQGFHLTISIVHAGGRDTTGTARPTKRVPVGAEAVEDAPLCTRNETVDQAVQSFDLIHGLSCDLFPKQVFPPQFSTVRELPLSHCRCA